jgi:hypothetical protein
MDIGGLIGCIMLPVQWSMKFVCALLWLMAFYFISKVFGVLENHRDASNISMQTMG